jgi:cell wall-associated NlpC family hydrolase
VVNVEGTAAVPARGELGRRRAVALMSAVAFGLLAGAQAPDTVLAAKLRGKDPAKAGRQKSKEKNKKKRKKNGKSGTKTSGTGEEIVQEAQKHKGSKYVMGGASPKGFDCSGFVWFVYQKVTGMDIGRTVEAQWDLGSSVSRGQLSQGDVVFFKNTFERGLSHCGISLGGTQFIHAENEGTGVVISDLGSGYYDEHYAGARRLV